MGVLEVLVEVRGAVASLAGMEEAEEERGEEKQLTARFTHFRLRPRAKEEKLTSARVM